MENSYLPHPAGDAFPSHKRPYHSTPTTLVFPVLSVACPRHEKQHHHSTPRTSIHLISVGDVSLGLKNAHHDTRRQSLFHPYLIVTLTGSTGCLAVGGLPNILLDRTLRPRGKSQSVERPAGCHGGHSLPSCSPHLQLAVARLELHLPKASLKTRHYDKDDFFD